MTKKFNYVLAVFASLYVAVLILLYLNWETRFFIKSIWFLNFAVVAWFLADHSELRNPTKLLVAFILAITIVPYTSFATNTFGTHGFYAHISSSLHALTLLVLQWPLRILYIKLFGDEPQIDRTSNRKDIAYTFILVMGTLFIQF